MVQILYVEHARQQFQDEHIDEEEHSYSKNISYGCNHIVSYH